MGENSKIQWTDHTFNPWIGCAKVSAGCANCYAEDLMDTRYHKAKWGVNGTRVPTSPANWREPVKWNREAERDGVRRRVFCASLADVFEDREELEPWRAHLFDLIDKTPHLDWLLLTKRPENIHLDAVRRNVWLGTSVENQDAADTRIPHLFKAPGAVRFLSCEPLLGPVDLGAYIHGLDWVIVGGESGNKARPCMVDWIRAIRDQCKEAGVACFIKQLGALPFTPHPGVEWNGYDFVYDDQLDLNDKKGGDWSEWPEDLRVREFPKQEPSPC